MNRPSYSEVNSSGQVSPSEGSELSIGVIFEAAVVVIFPARILLPLLQRHAPRRSCGVVIADAEHLVG